MKLGVQRFSHSLSGLGFGSLLRLRSRLPPPVEQPRLVPLLHAEQVREEISQSDLQEPSQHKVRRGDREVTYIERNERDEDPDVSPPVRILDIEREIQELVRGPERAELASRGGIWVSEIASGTRHVWVHVLRAGQTSRWVDSRVFDFRTGDLLSAEP